MVTKWPLSQREKHELTPHRLQRVFILRRTDGRMEAADTDSTHLNTEDFKGSDGIHQAVDDFVRL